MKINKVSESEMIVKVSGWPNRLLGLLAIALVGIIPFILGGDLPMVKDDHQTYVASTFGALGFVGLLVFLLSEDRVFRFAKGGDTEVSERRLFGRPHRSKYPTSSIVAVQQHSDGGSSGRETGFTVKDSYADLKLIVDGSTAIHVASKRNFMPGAGRVYEKEARQIAEFLGIRVDIKGVVTEPTNIVGTVGAIANAALQPTEPVTKQEIWEDQQHKEAHRALTPQELAVANYQNQQVAAQQAPAATPSQQPPAQPQSSPEPPQIPPASTPPLV